MTDAVTVNLTRTQACLYLDDRRYHRGNPTDPELAHLYHVVEEATANVRANHPVPLHLTSGLARRLLGEYDDIAAALGDALSGAAARGHARAARNAWQRLRTAGAETGTEYNKRTRGTN